MLIIINPGHSKNGNPDPGACHNNYKEYEEAARIAELVKQKFDSNNTNIEMRVIQQNGDIDSNKQLNKLVSDVNSLKADLMISIHLNAAAEQAKGIETLYYKSSKKGLLLANYIQDSLIEKTGRVNRGVKVDTRGLAVLRLTNMPTVLVEAGFISNIEESKWIHDNSHTVADSIVEGIIKYLINQKVLTEDFLDIPKLTKSVEIRLSSDNLKTFDCYVDNILKLKNNRLETCLEWIRNTYN